MQGKWRIYFWYLWWKTIHSSGSMVFQKSCKSVGFIFDIVDKLYSLIGFNGVPKILRKYRIYFRYLWYKVFINRVPWCSRNPVKDLFCLVSLYVLIILIHLKIPLLILSTGSLILSRAGSLILSRVPYLVQGLLILSWAGSLILSRVPYFVQGPLFCPGSLIFSRVPYFVQGPLFCTGSLILYRVPYLSRVPNFVQGPLFCPRSRILYRVPYFV